MESTRLTLSGTELCATCRAHDRCEVERRANNTPKCREAQIYERLAAYEDTGLMPWEIHPVDDRQSKDEVEQ